MGYISSTTAVLPMDGLPPVPASRGGSPPWGSGSDGGSRAAGPLVETWILQEFCDGGTLQVGCVFVCVADLNTGPASVHTRHRLSTGPAAQWAFAFVGASPRRRLMRGLRPPPKRASLLLSAERQ